MKLQTGSCCSQADSIRCWLHCVWLRVIHQTCVFAELRCFRATRGGIGLNSPCHIRVMTKPPSERAQPCSNKDVFLCVNIYSSSTLTGEYSQSSPESKSDLHEKIQFQETRAFLGNPSGLFVDRRNIVTVAAPHEHYHQQSSVSAEI